MTKYLARLGYEVTVLTSKVSGSGPIQGAHAVVRTSDLLASSFNWRRRHLDEGKVGATTPPPSPVESLIVPDVSAVSWLPFALRSARSLIRSNRPDCLVTTSPPQSAHVVGLRLAGHGLPWIAEFRDGWRFERPRGDWRFEAQRRLDDRLERSVARKADAIVAVTTPIADDLRERFDRPVELITNGFDPDDVDATAVGDAAAILDPDRVSIVHTGSMGFTGGSARPLVEALRLIRRDSPEAASRLELVFAGLLSTDEAALLGSPDLDGMVRCIGSLDRPAVLQLQRAADALLVITEGARRRSVATGKLFEYLATDRPILVLGSETEAGRIVLGAERGSAVPATDSQAIATELRRAAEGGWPSMSDRSRVERYSWAELAGHYAAVVDDVTGNVVS